MNGLIKEEFFFFFGGDGVVYEVMLMKREGEFGP